MAFASPHEVLGGLEEANRSIGKSQKGDPTVRSKDGTGQMAREIEQIPRQGQEASK